MQRPRDTSKQNALSPEAERPDDVAGWWRHRPGPTASPFTARSAAGGAQLNVAPAQRRRAVGRAGHHELEDILSLPRLAIVGEVEHEDARDTIHQAGAFDVSATGATPLVGRQRRRAQPRARTMVNHLDVALGPEFTERNAGLDGEGQLAAPDDDPATPAD